jgi:hypothetical protein
MERTMLRISVVALLFFLGLQSCWAQAIEEGIILKDTSDAVAMPAEPKTIGPYGEAKSLSLTTKPHIGTAVARYRRTLAHWKDVLALPHSRMACVTWASGNWPTGGGWKTCVGWKTQFQWLWNEADLDMMAAVNVDLQGTANECLTEGAVAAAIAAVVAAYTTAGEAAGPAAEEAFVSALSACATAHSVNAQITLPITSSWGSWE